MKRQIEEDCGCILFAHYFYIKVQQKEKNGHFVPFFADSHKI